MTRVQKLISLKDKLQVETKTTILHLIDVYHKLVEVVSTHHGHAIIGLRAWKD